MLRIENPRSLSSIVNIDQWSQLSKNEVTILTTRLASYLEGFCLVDIADYKQSQLGFYVARFEHEQSKLKFMLIPGGEFEMGLSKREEELIIKLVGELPFDPEILRPLSTKKVNPFLITQLPITEAFSIHSGLIDNNIDRVDFGELPEFSPASLTLAEALRIAKWMNFDIPSEIQWEYAARGNMKNCLFPNGNLSNKTQIERSLCFTDFSNVEAYPDACNNFGLIGLSVGEWCYSAHDNNFVIRGGPVPQRSTWQTGYEWCLGISAMRYSQQNTFDVPQFGVRLLEEIVISI